MLDSKLFVAKKTVRHYRLGVDDCVCYIDNYVGQ